MDTRTKFERLVLQELLPRYCYEYGYSIDGFRTDTLSKISEHDAAWFLEALRTQTVISDHEFFRAAQDGAKEYIFWAGKKSKSPRQMSLWLEPVITIGAAGRLHSQFGWPRERIGLQSKSSWASDLVAYDVASAPLVACEIKKSMREIDALICAMVNYISRAPLNEEPAQSVLRNAYRKVKELRKKKPSLVWILGPSNYGKVFSFTSSTDAESSRLDEVREDALSWESVRPTIACSGP